MRQFKEMLHLGIRIPANFQDVLVQGHANKLPVRALQRQQMVLNAAICAAFATDNRAEEEEILDDECPDDDVYDDEEEAG